VAQRAQKMTVFCPGAVITRNASEQTAQQMGTGDFKYLSFHHQTSQASSCFLLSHLSWLHWAIDAALSDMWQHITLSGD